MTSDPEVKSTVSSPEERALEIPAALIASHATFFGAAGRAWIDALPELAAECTARWGLRRDGAPMCGAVALVLPVLREDGAAAVLKLQPIDAQTIGEPLALRAWDGRGAVRLLRHHPDSGAMLLERLDAGRSLAAVADDLVALQLLSELLARLTAVPAPPGLRTLAEEAAEMLGRVPAALALLPDPAQRRLVRSCAGAVAELLPEAGTALLHWDLHYDNVLTRRPGPGSTGADTWVAIDPKPLAGDPGFELLAALHNRWEDVVATGDVPGAIRRRFDLMTEVLDTDRERARGWTLGRILQTRLWEVETDNAAGHAAADRAIAQVLLS